MNKIRLIRILAAMALPLSAAEFFVSPQGDDARDGLARERAFGSLQRGLDALAPGDILTIGPGEYRGTASRAGLGSAATRTVIRAEIDGTAILRGDLPMPPATPVPGRKQLHVIETPHDVQCINEVDTLTLYEIVPNLTEAEFTPGSYFQDAAAGRVYFSTSDGQPPDRHSLTLSVANGAGLLLTDPTNATIQGIAAAGYNKNTREQRPGTLYGARVGIGILRGSGTVIRHCTAFLNGAGIATMFAENPLIEHCTAYANYSKFASTSGNLCCWNPNGGTIRHCRSFASLQNEIRFYGSVKGLCRLEDNIAPNMYFKGGAGAQQGVMERCVTESFVLMYSTNVFQSIATSARADGADRSNIVFAETPGLRPEDEFADPVNQDYRLQASSRFRAAHNGRDQGPHPYEPTVFYVKPDGSDAADGLSVASAWRSPARAVGALRPGDTLYFLPGVYTAALEIAVAGTAERPVAIRGRGTGRVVLNGPVTVSNSAHLSLERLNFIGGDVTASDGAALAVSHCGFNRPLTLRNVRSPAVEHCALAGGMVLAQCQEVRIRDNIIVNERTAGITLFEPVEGLIGWNSFNQAENCRARVSASDPASPATVTSIAEEPYSLVLQPDFTAPDEGAFTLANDHLFNGRGSLGLPLGPHRRVRVEKALRILDPAVLAVSATTADIEWRTSAPSTTELHWGETPDCPNRLELIYGERTFHTLSLTGLRPGATYHFQALATSPGYEIHGNPEGEALDLRRRRTRLSSAPGSFTTLVRDPAPATWHVRPTGDDRATGRSEEEAWRTISHAAAQAGPGDTVLIGGGHYQETVRFRRAGAAQAPIRFRCKPGERVWLDGNNLELNNAIQILGKQHLQIDGLYFRAYGSGVFSSAIFTINGGGNIEVTRCFYDGRFSGYTPGFMSASSCSNLLVRNCFMTRGFSGPRFHSCRDLRFVNSVIYINQIGLMFFLGQPEDRFTFRRNIVVDNIAGKAKQPLFLVSSALQMDEGDNCFHLRFPQAGRLLIREGSQAMTWDEFNAKAGRQSTSLFDDPRFLTVPALTTFASADDLSARLAERSRELAAEHAPGKDWDFDDFFTTHPALVRHGVGLQPEAFAEFNFERP